MFEGLTRFKDAAVKRPFIFDHAILGSECTKHTRPIRLKKGGLRECGSVPFMDFIGQVDVGDDDFIGQRLERRSWPSQLCRSIHGPYGGKGRTSPLIDLSVRLNEHSDRAIGLSEGDKTTDFRCVWHGSHQIIRRTRAKFTVARIENEILTVGAF